MPYEQVVKILMESFISEHMETVKASFSDNEDVIDKSNLNFVCHVGQEFCSWINELNEQDDDCLKTCALFVSMANKFFQLVQRLGIPLRLAG